MDRSLDEIIAEDTRNPGRPSGGGGGPRRHNNPGRRHERDGVRKVRPPFPLRILFLLRANRSQSSGSLETRQRTRHGKDMEKNFARYLI